MQGADCVHVTVTTAAAHSERSTIVSVLDPNLELIACFVSVTEAWRYASLLYAPGFVPWFNRSRDGAIVAFDCCPGVRSLYEWVFED